jgi:plasmid stabilization system protein ParE
MKQYEVKLTEEAELDLLDVYNYMARNYSAEKALRLSQ